MGNSKVYYKLYNPCGLFNQVLSLEAAIGIQHKAKREMVIYNISNNSDGFSIYHPDIYGNRYSDMISKQQKIRIDDLFSWESQNQFTFNDELDKEQLQNIEKYSLFKFFLIDKGKELDNIKEFASNRFPFYIGDNDINLTRTLVSYSYLFYHRDKELDRQIGSLAPKNEYLNLAKKIAESLGDFDAIHLRLTDFPIYIYRVTQEMFDEAIESFDSGRKMVIATDDPDHAMLKNVKDSAIFLDKYIYENFVDEFKSLPFNDNVVFGLINNLVLHYSNEFVGTLGSTYTSYIQKGRIRNGLPASWKFFNDLSYKKSGTYSWTNYPIADEAKSWWREWEECSLIGE